MKKRVLALVLILIMALPFVLAGCDDDPAKGVSAETTAPLPSAPASDDAVGAADDTVDTGEATEPSLPENDPVKEDPYPVIVDLSAMPAGTPEQYSYLYDQVVLGDEAITGRSYLAHPDSVLLDNGDIITAFSLGHGTGGTFMRISHDRGLTWETLDLPECYAGTEETPTIYKLNFTDGTQKLVLIAGRPSWPAEGNLGEGWDAAVSVSLDPDGGCDGLVWSELENFYGPNAVREEYYRLGGAKKFDAVVAMSSLTQMKDENGEFIDKWMGLYHDDRNFTVYKTYLTFNEEGQMEWSEPVRMLGQNGEWREYEENYIPILDIGGHAFCETEVLRSPDGNELAAIFRVNSKNSFSYVTFSTDEGETWSEPQTLSAELTGERHKAEYDPVTGKLVITMRNIFYRRNITEPYNWKSRGWVTWIGDYEDLKLGADGHGDMLVKMAHTYNAGDTEIQEFANADTGYAGLVVYDDGTFVTAAYGVFSPADDPERGGDTYIMSKRFTVTDLFDLAGIPLD